MIKTQPDLGVNAELESKFDRATKFMGKKLAEMSWDSIVVLVLALAGWIYTAGIMSAHVEDARSRLERVEQKLDVLSQDVYKYAHQ